MKRWTLVIILLLAWGCSPKPPNPLMEQPRPELEALFRWSPYFGESISQFSDKGFLRIYDSEPTALFDPPQGNLLAEIPLPSSSKNMAKGRSITFGCIAPTKILKSGMAKSFKIFSSNGKMIIVSGPIHYIDLNTYDFLKDGLVTMTKLELEQPAPTISPPGAYWSWESEMRAVI